MKIKEELVDSLEIEIQEIVNALKKDNDFLRFVPQEIKENRAFLLKAIGVLPQSDIEDLFYTFKNFRDDKEIVMKMVKADDSALHYVSKELKDDAQVAFAAVKKNPYALMYCSERLQANRNLVKLATTGSGFPIQYASDDIKDDEEFMFEIIKKHKNGFQYTSERLQDKRDFVIKSLREDPSSFYAASDRLRDDEEIVLMVLEQHPHALEYVSERLKMKSNILSLAYQKNSTILEFFPDGIRESCLGGNVEKVLENLKLKEELETDLEIQTIKPKRIKI